VKNIGSTLKICGWCTVFVVAEAGLYLSYRHHDARFHWFLHFFVGGSAALLLMSAVAWVRRRPIPYPLVWVLIGHIFAMAPDLMFLFFGVVHDRWMDVFLWHIGGHFVPGQNVLWYSVFLGALAVYFAVLTRVEGAPAFPPNKYSNR